MTTVSKTEELSSRKHSDKPEKTLSGIRQDASEIWQVFDLHP